MRAKEIDNNKDIFKKFIQLGFISVKYARYMDIYIHYRKSNHENKYMKFADASNEFKISEEKVKQIVSFLES